MINGNDHSVSTDAPRVLAVDNETATHGVLERLFPREGIHVTTCTSGDEALDLLEEGSFDLALTNAQLPEMGGLELLDRIDEHHPGVSVVLLSAQDNAQQAVRAIRKGAADFIPKPFSTDELVKRVTSILEDQPERHGAAVTNGHADAPPEAASSAPPNGTSNGHVNGASPSENGECPSDTVTFVGEHQSVQTLRDMVDRIADSRAPVFVQGESGTGKEILSRLVHEKSNRADQPYVPVNCAALPSDLVESHLFGHVEGAFTGAVDDMVGAFEKADGGTLLLDEITEITPSVQANLLRVLQTQEFQKVGASETKTVDVRVIATSNRDLQEEVEEGTFREDLYHRLAVFPLHIPPLRGRLSDIPLLAEHFIEKFAAQYHLPEKTLAPDLLQYFQTYSWPGNVRELENMIHRGVVMAGNRDCITKDDVLDHFFSGEKANGEHGPSQNGTSIGEIAEEGSIPTIDEMERRLILSTLAEEGVSQKQAAEELGISARTIRNKLEEYREQGFSI
jgi:two-component system response regulator FlrC